MGLFTTFYSGLKKTQSKLSTEIRRIVTRSPKLTEDDIEELEAALLTSDMGLAVTQRIITAVRETYESGGTQERSLLDIAQAEVVSCLGDSAGHLAKCDGPTVVSLVGVNGTGKTTTAAKDGRFSTLILTCATKPAVTIRISVETNSTATLNARSAPTNFQTDNGVAESRRRTRRSRKETI